MGNGFLKTGKKTVHVAGDENTQCVHGDILRHVYSRIRNGVRCILGSPQDKLQHQRVLSAVAVIAAPAADLYEALSRI